MKKYNYHVNGKTAEGVGWTCIGQMEVEFADLFNRVMVQTFADLTEGKAIFGRPGQGGCKGPYEVDRVILELDDGTKR